MSRKTEEKWAYEPCPMCNGARMKSKGAKSCKECRYQSFKDALRKCTECGVELSQDNWSDSDQYNHFNICKSCKSVKSKDAYKTRRVYYRGKNQELKKEVIDHYGGKCVCCGVDDLVFLALDHINNDGNIHRFLLTGRAGRNSGGGGRTTYKWVKDNGFPDTFQVLCHNCNFAKSNGGCPHNGKTKEYEDVIVVSPQKKSYKCSKCGMEFSRSGSKANHVRYKHPQAMEYGEPIP